jgi:6-pyruvoyltetrahydropterin/6-carboxytetrahydropterin synthase
MIHKLKCKNCEKIFERERKDIKCCSIKCARALNSKAKKGKNNPACRQEVRDRISATVKKQYEKHKKENLPYGFQKGEKNPSWKEVTKKKVAEKCFKDYGRKCFICDRKEKKTKKVSNIFIHHLNHIHEDDRDENVIPVCDSCHQKLHRWWKGWTLHIKKDIDYGHHLPNHKGKCYYSHGHTAIIDLKVCGLTREDGMVIDFTYLKKMLSDVIEPFDHAYLNTLEDNPTSEKLASLLYHRMELALYEHRKKFRRIVWMEELELSEGIGKTIIIR